VLRNTSAKRAAAHSIVHDAADHKWADVFHNRNVPLNMCGMLCWLTVLTVLGDFFPSYLIDHLQMDLPNMGLVMSAIGFGGSAGNLAMPGVSDRIGRRPVVILNVVVDVACLLLLMRTGANVGALFGLLFVIMFCLFANITLTVGPMTVEAAPAKLMGTASGIVVGVAEAFGGGVAPAMGGYSAKHFGIATTLPLATVGMALGIIVALAVKETAPVKQRAPR
jgi:predicted MFS family arabinose efflux permease